MKTKEISTILMALALGASIAMASTAEYERSSGKKDASQSAAPGMKDMPHDQMMMANESHHVLAMAYHQNLATFAKALHEHTAGASSVNVEFTRAAVTEMRRSFDQMKQHHQEHMKTMSADMRTKMNGMLQQMETHQTELNTQLTALEQEVQAATPDAKKVSTLAGSIRTHCDAMPKMHQSSHESEMKIKN